mgnify:CR=1 FL=1
METAKLFKNGQSQAIRLPKKYRFKGKEVYINKLDNIIIIVPKNNPWATLLNSLNLFSDDFMETRNQPQVQTRTSFL